MRVRGPGLLRYVAIAGLAGLLSPQMVAYSQDTPSSSREHVVQPGESVLDVELFYNVTGPDLDTSNVSGDPALIGGGQTLYLAAPPAAPMPAQPPNASAPNMPMPPQSAPAIGGPVAEAPPVSADPPGIYTVQRGDTLFRIATQYGLPMWALASANGIQNLDTIYVGQQLKVNINPADYPQPAAPAQSPKPAYQPPPVQTPNVTAPAAPDPSGKQVLVVLSEQMVYAYENGQLLRQFAASTGLPGTPTVQGHFAIYLKYDAQRMVGPDYDLPGVPWVMYFYRGYALHGTYWHNNFGHPMSHGCVNLRTGEAEWMYVWAPIGTPVTVVY